jgi:hypothetical protein
VLAGHGDAIHCGSCFVHGDIRLCVSSTISIQVHGTKASTGVPTPLLFTVSYIQPQPPRFDHLVTGTHAIHFQTLQSFSLVKKFAALLLGDAAVLWLTAFVVAWYIIYPVTWLLWSTQPLTPTKPLSAHLLC